MEVRELIKYLETLPQNTRVLTVERVIDNETIDYEYVELGKTLEYFPDTKVLSFGPYETDYDNAPNISIDEANEDISDWDRR